ncbi:hypothetical protein [Halomonas tibetensis]|uniref:Uncharacterized protein n=1 Tax=Halomonas tibetensis TaxID=2259590 RepID=A0ABV7B0H7_9GAMM
MRERLEHYQVFLYPAAILAGPDASPEKERFDTSSGLDVGKEAHDDCELVRRNIC